MALLRYIFGSRDSTAFDLHKVQTSTLSNERSFYQQDHSQKICLSRYLYASHSHCVVCEPNLKRVHSGLNRYGRQSATRESEASGQKHLLLHSVVNKFHKAVQ